MRWKQTAYNQVYSYGFNEENHPGFKTNTNRSSRGSHLASTLIQDLQGLLQLALTLSDTLQKPMLVGGQCSRGSYNLRQP